MNRMTKSNVALAEQLIESIQKEYDACGIAVAVIKREKHSIRNFSDTGTKKRNFRLTKILYLVWLLLQNHLQVWRLCRWQKKGFCL